jgi:hypothetical protein
MQAAQRHGKPRTPRSAASACGAFSRGSVTINLSRPQHSHHANVAPKLASSIFILAAYVENRLHAHSLALTLFSVHRFHPNSRVVVVDNGSPSRITPELFPAPVGRPKLHRWFRHHVHVIRRKAEAINKREYGSYSDGIQFIANSTSSWAADRFEQFVFMQASIILSEPVPRAGAAEWAGCEVQPFQTFGDSNGGEDPT